MSKIEIVKYTKKLLQNVNDIDDIVDSYFEPFKDLTDTAEDIFTPIKVVHSLYTFNKKRKFKSFLKSYAQSLNSSKFDSLDTNRLLKYLEKEKNFNFIYEIIDGAINSKSKFCSSLLGSYAGNILKETPNIGFKEILVLEALREINDYELSLFTKVYSIIDFKNIVSLENYGKKFSNVFLYELMIQKMISLRVFEKAPILASGRPKASFKSTEIAEDIFFLIKDMDIYLDLLEYE